MGILASDALGLVAKDLEVAACASVQHLLDVLDVDGHSVVTPALAKLLSVY